RAPIALAALVLLGKLPTSVSAAAPGVPRERFDLVGAGLLAIALVALLLALNRIREPLALLLGAGALAVLAAFVWWEARSARPILDPRVFRAPGFALLNLCNLLTSLASFAVWLLVPFYLARETDFGVTVSGAVLATAWVGTMLASPVAGRLIGRVSARTLALVGAVLVALGLYAIGRWEAGTPALALIAALAVQGVGWGLFQLAYTDIVTATIPRQNRGVAGSLAMLTRTVGVVSAASLILPLFQALQTDGFFPAFERCFTLAALLALAMAATVAIGVRR
ncbi:MAG: MFS transporter, partial [Alphaproteobacteria bacterium]|nr:MFS transporter [Alphaproteobacteria bacterium]